MFLNVVPALKPQFPIVEPPVVPVFDLFPTIPFHGKKPLSRALWRKQGALFPGITLSAHFYTGVPPVSPVRSARLPARRIRMHQAGEAGECSTHRLRPRAPSPLRHEAAIPKYGWLAAAPPSS